MKKEIKNLTLLLLYLCGWQEDSRNDPDLKIHRAWKGFSFEALNELEGDGLLQQLRNAKSVILTAEGLKKAEEIKATYLKETANEQPF